MVKRIAVFFLGVAVVALGFGLGERFVPTGLNRFIPTLHAIVGRPLTPVSVAGVARRTSRRCAADVYDC
jgi:hypothetical protein